jgi:colicin import membrane protein
VRNRLHRIPGRYRAVVYAALVHVAVAAVLIVGFDWTTPPEAPALPPLQASVVEDPDVKRQEQERERQRQESQRQIAEAERERKAEEERKRVEAQRQLDEQRRLEQQRKIDEERKRQEEIKRKHEEERKRKDEERKKADAENKRQEMKKKEDDVRRKESLESLKQQLEAEERARADTAKSTRAATEADKYKALIRDKVSRNWIRPLGAKTGLRCVVRVRLVPGGDVLEAVVVKGSGNPVFDRSVEAAVHKASPLPLPADPELFDYFRDIEFLFNPEAG